MNILSLFDGISCGQVALNRADINYDQYFASEVDKYAIQVTQKNFPNTDQLGDVQNWRQWNLPEIDLLLAGSPCQGFSFAGKQLNFQDSRSKLFFEFVDILQNYRPKWFLLENVKMKKEWRDIISDLVQVQPIEINSALVSAQNRKRLYWTNIPGISQPSDKGIVLRDILEHNIILNGALRGRYIQDGSIAQFVELRHDSKTNALTTVSKDNVLIYQLPRGFNKGGFVGKNGKCPSITTSSWQYNNLLTDGMKCRLLTPVECERLQTVPDNYTDYISKTQRYKCLGNAWTVDVVSHILCNLNRSTNFDGTSS